MQIFNAKTPRHMKLIITLFSRRDKRFENTLYTSVCYEILVLIITVWHGEYPMHKLKWKEISIYYEKILDKLRYFLSGIKREKSKLTQHYYLFLKFDSLKDDTLKYFMEQMPSRDIIFLPRNARLLGRPIYVHTCTRLFVTSLHFDSVVIFRTHTTWLTLLQVQLHFRALQGKRLEILDDGCLIRVNADANLIGV